MILKEQGKREKNSIKHVIGARKGMGKYELTDNEREWLENRESIHCYQQAEEEMDSEHS